MSGVVTRSQSQGDKEDNNMESHNKDNTTGMRQAINSSSKKIKTSELLSDNSSDNEVAFQNKGASNKKTQDNQDKSVKAMANKHGKLSAPNHDGQQNDQHAEIHKGYVAERVDKINSNPSTPSSSAKMPKTKSNVSRNRTLVSQNGQLGLQSSQQFASALSSKLSKVADKADEQIEQEDTISLTSVLKELAGSVKKLQIQLDRMDKSNKRVDKKVSAVELVQQQEITKLNGVIDQLDEHDDKIQALVGIVVRQDQQIQALTNQVNAAQASKCHKNIIINGIPETQGENPLHEVAHFFKHILKLSAPVSIKYARRMGKGQYKPMLVRLQKANDKALIFQNLDKLKEPNKSKDRPFFVTDHLPEAWAERKRSIHYLKQQNKHLPPNQQFKIAVKNNTLLLDDTEYKPPFTAPTVHDFLHLSKERKSVIRDLQVIKGEEETEHKSVFIGYAAQVFSIKQVEDHYHPIRLLNPEATHVMCAYKLPGVDFTKIQGAVDDGEHAGGRVILKMLLKEQSVNQAVFVVRYYGGKHLGQRRFSLIEKVAVSAHSKLQQHVRNMRKPPTQQELDEYRRNHPTDEQNPTSWAVSEDETSQDDEQYEEQYNEEESQDEEV